MKHRFIQFALTGLTTTLIATASVAQSFAQGSFFDKNKHEQLKQIKLPPNVNQKLSQKPTANEARQISILMENYNGAMFESSDSVHFFWGEDRGFDFDYLYYIGFSEMNEISPIPPEESLIKQFIPTDSLHSYVKDGISGAFGAPIAKIVSEFSNERLNRQTSKQKDATDVLF